ncbi:ABC transporter ATP-binding protein [Rhodococcoides kyotonense]|uniref:Trehalose import ATP-binding protein SugC n=1 Tax=Rhodococcoides kyotonense TaxID=398843 RepID=A0A239M019_9NOCA|nr:ABC transporter ATP-binding protein [Rhodococcus kyotonensis]SNT35870.1 iron(III) transport system ATP-binding protein [Rhodococcus kyotonensis]
MSQVQIKELTRRYIRGAAAAVDDVSVDVEDGEFLVLLGPSGCGKTTLLRCLAGLEKPNGGEIVIGGQVAFDAERSVATPPYKRDIGMVFQNYSLWPHMSIARNVAYPLSARKVKSSERKSRVMKALGMVECEGLADRLPSSLSGGQQQRIALARAVVAEPRLMLFDEPLSNLDYRLRAQLREEIREIHRRLNFTALYVTHDQTEALQLGTRVAVMKLGRIEQIDTPEAVFSWPSSVYVADFLGITNRLSAQLRSGRWTAGATAVAFNHEPGLMPDDKYTLFMRNSDVSLRHPNKGSANPSELRLQSATIVDILYGGERSDWVVDLDGVRLQASAAVNTWSHQIGDTVDVVLPSAAVLHYGSDDQLVRPSCESVTNTSC